MATRMQDALKHPTDFRRLRNIPQPAVFERDPVFGFGG
jgi:hypothetical protein